MTNECIVKKAESTMLKVAYNGAIAVLGVSTVVMYHIWQASNVVNKIPKALGRATECLKKYLDSLYKEYKERCV